MDGKRIMSKPYVPYGTKGYREIERWRRHVCALQRTQTGGRKVIETSVTEFCPSKAKNYCSRDPEH